MRTWPSMFGLRRQPHRPAAGVARARRRAQGQLHPHRRVADRQQRQGAARGPDEGLEPRSRRGAIKLVADGWAQDWTADAAREDHRGGAWPRARARWLASSPATNVTAGGAIRVLEAREPWRARCRLRPGCRARRARRIVAGTQTMTVYKSLRTMTRLAARSAVLLAKGEKVDTARW